MASRFDQPDAPDTDRYESTPIDVQDEPVDEIVAELPADFGTPDPVVTTDRRTAFIRSLRACADFLEAHPLVQAPIYNVMNTFVHSRDEIAAQARAATWQKIYNDSWFSLVHEFGDDLRLEINCSRETVCRKIVTGTKIQPATPEREVEIVEWVCEDASLLATGDK